MDIYQQVSRFYERANVPKTVFGKSLFHRNLYALKIGEGKPVGLAQYAIHGREWITAKLALHHFSVGVYGTLWIVPLLNPDGALLSQCGLQSAINSRERKRLLRLCPNNDFTLWKANGRGVDLNVNFDARYGKGAKNVLIAGAENYIGKYPFSEPETRAIKRFTLQICPNYTISYHTKGEEIYWQFYQSPSETSRDYRLATVLSNSTGYPLAIAKGSAGGYKDWCIQRLRIPSFTVEVGKDSLTHPLGEEALQDIIEKNGDALKRLSEEYRLL